MGTTYNISDEKVSKITGQVLVIYILIGVTALYIN